MPDLLPCPFCGSTKLKLENLGDGDDWFVSCSGCEVQQIANYLKDVAVKRWNQRAVSSSLESRWISVKDRMPEPGRDVLIFVLDDYDGHKNYQIVDCYDEQASEWDEVTHWMELPAAPSSTETQTTMPTGANWADDHSLAEAHKRDCELMPCGHMRKQAIYYMPGGMGCLECERDQARAALREKEAELATAKQELLSVDMVLDRRTALDDFKTRSEKVSHACNTASQADLFERRLKTSEQCRNAQSRELERLRGAILKRGHYDTCSHALGEQYACDCPLGMVTPDSTPPQKEK